MLSIVRYIITLLAGLVSAAEFAHSGQAAAGNAKRAWVLSQLEQALAATPTIPGVNATVVSVVMLVIRALVPLFGGQVIDWIVAKLNSSSFFVSIEAYLAELLTALSDTSTTTQAAV